jgi:hypothetical protein
MAVQPRDWAACNVTDDISACPARRKTNRIKSLHSFREGVHG